ncbi:MAG: hypothetical protein ABIR70_20940 [Bryobacteraceae bacterium]
MRPSLLILTVLAAALVLTACGDDVYDDGAAKATVEGAKIALSGEPVILSPDQVLCGEKQGLWDIDQLDSGGARGRLTAAGQALKFAEDIRMGDGKYSGPYTSMLGSFSLKVLKLDKVIDEKPDVKIVEGKMGVVIDHTCFAKPITLLGTNRGDFTEDFPPQVRLVKRGGWTVDQLLH